MQKNKIFVQIASYRDLQLVPTIEDMLKKAKNPQNLTFGICWQYDHSEPINYYDNNLNFRVKKCHYSKSEGLGWARSETNKLYDNEEFTLQIDSHHRFVDGWDDMILEDFNQAKSISEKPIITTYCTPFNPDDDPKTWNLMPCLMSQYEFSSDKLLMSMPWYIQDYKSRNKVIRARTISGHFYFTYGSFIQDVPYDPDIYFGGYTEETTLSLRAFTSGYDFFSPYRQIMWHEYTRNYRPKHWDDHGQKSETSKTSTERDVLARKKTRQLFGTEDYGIDMGRFNIGDKRSIHDYEVYGGFDFKKCLIQDYTLKVKEPPNPTNWEYQFLSKKISVPVNWDKDFFKKMNFKKPKFLTLGIHNKSGVELFRKDFLDNQYLNFEKNSYRAEFNCSDNPYKIVMYLYDEEKNWSERYEKVISK